MNPFAAAIAVSALIAAPETHSQEIAGWSLATCDSPEVEAGRAVGDARIRGAAPGTNLWVPHPFSTVEAEIVENVLARHREAFSDLPDTDLSSEDARLFQLSRKRALRTELVRVADWTPVRCDKSERRNAYWLIRFFDTRSNKEVTRVLARESGLISRVVHTTSEYTLPPLPALRVPKEFAAELSEVNSSSVQYVSTWGPDECDPLAPCVAWRLDTGVALLKGQRLFIVSDHSDRFSGRDDLSNLRTAAVAARVRAQGKELVSLGGDLFAAAEVVEKQAPPRVSP